MEETQRVDIKLKKSTLKWAAVKAAKQGISRRQFLADMLEDTKNMLEKFESEWNSIVEAKPE